MRPAIDSVVAILVIVLLARYLSAVHVTGPNHRVYGQLLEHRTWSVLAATSVVAWLLAVVRTGHIAVCPLRDRRSLAGLRLFRGGVPIALYLILVLTLLRGAAGLIKLGLDHPVPAALAQRTFLLLVVGLLAAGAPIVGMWHAYARLRDLSVALSGEGRTWTAREFLGELRRTWADAQRCLVALSVIIATATVMTGAFRNTLLAAGYSAAQLPRSGVLLYGGLFTVLSLIIYVPLYVAWRSRVTRFIDRLYPLPGDARPTAEWAGARARVQTLLGADITLGKNLTAAAGILAPLATSLLTVFIPHTG